MWKPGTFQKTDRGLCRIVREETATDYIVHDIMVKDHSINFKWIYNTVARLVKLASADIRLRNPEIPEGYTTLKIPQNLSVSR